MFGRWRPSGFPLGFSLMGTLTDWRIIAEQLQTELQHVQLQHQRQRVAAITERAVLRRLLDEARDERDRARDALALWSAVEYDAAVSVERALEREQRALASASRMLLERDRAYEVIRELVAHVRRDEPRAREVASQALAVAAANSAHRGPRSPGSGEYGAANG